MRFVVVAAIAVVVCAGFCGIGAWIWFGPGSGCRTARPDGITRDDLAGTYHGAGGGSVTLDADGTDSVDVGRADAGEALAGSGTWDLRPDSGHSDILLWAGDGYLYLDIGGTRDRPFLFRPASGQPCGQYRFTRT